MPGQILQHPARSATAEELTHKQYTELDSVKDDDAPAPKQIMQYTYVDPPVEPTGRQNRFFLAKLKETTAGITTVELTAMGVVDPRPRIRDLRELGWRIETIQDGPHDVGRYVLMTGKGEL